MCGVQFNGGCKSWSLILNLPDCPGCLTFSMWLYSARRAGGNPKLLHGVLHRRWFRTVAVRALETTAAIIADLGTDKFMPALPKEALLCDFRPSPTLHLSQLFHCTRLSAAMYGHLPWHVAYTPLRKFGHPLPQAIEECVVKWCLAAYSGGKGPSLVWTSTGAGHGSGHGDKGS